MIRRKEKQCGYCNKTYMPKSNNSKYCSRKCKIQKDMQWKKEQRKNNPIWREKTNQQTIKRWKERYHNEPGYKEKHYQIHKKYSLTENGRKKYQEISKRYYYKNHEENKRKQAQRHREKYWNDKQYHEKILQRNREARKNNPEWNRTHKENRNGKKCIPLWEALFLNEGSKEPIEDAHLHTNAYGWEEILTFHLPKITHQYISARLNNSKEKHGEHTNKWIETIYQINLKNLLTGYP